MPSHLLDRLTTRYDEAPAARVMDPKDGQPNWVAHFGGVMREVRSIVAHLTAGWPRRDTANTFVEQYIVPGTSKRGEGPQFYISRDGTVARLIDLPRRTGHATFVNGWALGVETGNLGDVAEPPSIHWISASAELEDIPGAKLWITSGRPVHTEVLPCWWTTPTFSGSNRGGIHAGWMLFSEQQYRAWAALARYLMEEYQLPRNFPLLPHQRRSTIMRASAPFRRIVLADERADMLKRAFAAAPINIQEINFADGNAAALQAEYTAAVAAAGGNLKQHNRAWRALFDLYRGLHGHGYSGAIGAGHADHDCPGPLFDFHRLAREVWGWWWYPFDVEGGTTNVARRAYLQWDGDTPLLEYYFDEAEITRRNRVTVGIHGAASSPATFSLDPHSPIYALANGELVAARFPPPGDGVSLAFVLVRHEVYHLDLFANEVAWSLGFQAPRPGALDYDRSPSSVYSLYMHLGRPADMTHVHEDNPDWLNRMLIRKKECDLGVAFHDDDPNQHGIEQAVWDNRPPGVPRRPTTLEGWRSDRAALDTFLTTLGTGDVAVAPPRNPSVQPTRILLGDFLGECGVIRRQDGVDTHGIRVETFSPSFSPPRFERADTLDWTVQPGMSPPVALRYCSEWARVPIVEAPLQAIGVDTNYINWWPAVALASQMDALLPAEARLPRLGSMFHFHPLDFMAWLNDLTWRHEWPKYEVTDAAGDPVPIADAAGNVRQPRTRRL